MRKNTLKRNITFQVNGKDEIVRFLVLLCFITFTLVKRISIAFFLRLHFFGLTQILRIFGHALLYYRIFVLLFENLMQHIWFGVYQIYTQGI